MSGLVSRRTGISSADYVRLRERALARLEAFPAGNDRLSAIDALIDAEREIESWTKVAKQYESALADRGLL